LGVTRVTFRLNPVGRQETRRQGEGIMDGEGTEAETFARDFDEVNAAEARGTAGLARLGEGASDDEKNGAGAVELVMLD
jgi:hypothetical protein